MTHIAWNTGVPNFSLPRRKKKWSEKEPLSHSEKSVFNLWCDVDLKTLRVTRKNSCILMYQKYWEAYNAMHFCAVNDSSNLYKAICLFIYNFSADINKNWALMKSVDTFTYIDNVSK